MSLANAPFGFRAIRHASGGEPRAGKHKVSSAATRIYKGDVVDLQNSTGLVVRRVATSTERVLGVAAQQFNQSGTAGVEIMVYDDPSNIFEVMVANATNAITQAFFGNPRRVVSDAGDSTLGYSKEYLSTAATAASASYVIMPLRLSPKLDNDLALNSVVECIISGDAAKIARV